MLAASTSSVRRHGSLALFASAGAGAAPPPLHVPSVPRLLILQPARTTPACRLLQLGTVCNRFQSALQSPEALRGISVQVGCRRTDGLVQARSLRAWLASGCGARLRGLSLAIQHGGFGWGSKACSEGEQHELVLAAKGCLAACTQLQRLRLDVLEIWDAHGVAMRAVYRLPETLTALCLGICAAQVRCWPELGAGPWHCSAAAAWQPELARSAEKHAC